MITDEAGRIRVKIVQAVGIEVIPGVVATDPEVSLPHHDKLGWMQESPCEALGGRNNPRIELDNGEIIWGYQCWWDYAKEAANS